MHLRLTVDPLRVEFGGFAALCDDPLVDQGRESPL